MSSINDILGEGGAIARRLGEAYEVRPQQLQMAAAVERALEVGQHLIVEAGTGVGKSFAYLLPAIDYVIRTRKRVVISTHTIALQEQLVEKDIPLIQAVYPDEFSAVLVKGRGNYLCLRRLDQARLRQYMMFDTDGQIGSLQAIQEWAETTRDGSLTSLPVLPDPSVWEKVNAEQGNCMGKRCRFYEPCHWQAAKRRMQSGQLLIVNHALFFSDLALRSAGVNYLPKYDAVIFDEAHTLEDVAGQHFGLRLSDASVKYQLRALYDPRKGSGVLSTHGAAANDAIRCVIELGDVVDTFFDRVAWWQETYGRANGRVHESNIVPNDLSPKLNDLAKFLKDMLPKMEDDEEAIGEIGNLAARVGGMAETIEVMLTQSMPDAVYWFDVSKRTPRRVNLHAAPIDVAEGLRQHLFAKVPRVILTSATLATAGEGKRAVRRGFSSTGVPPVERSAEATFRRGAHLPHLTQNGGIYAVAFRTADSLPPEALAKLGEELSVIRDDDARKRERTSKIQELLDRGMGSGLLARDIVASCVRDALNHFDEERYRLLAWCIMPNHVHLVLRPLGVHELPQIMHSIKSFTSHRIKQLVSMEDGKVWQEEYYDHLVRDAEDLSKQVEYVRANPEKAGLVDWPWVSVDEDRFAEEYHGISVDHGRDARATGDRATFVPPDPRFAFVQRRLGVDEAQTLHLGSPFDYERQATLYIENDLPDPSDNLRFLPAACEKILRYLDMTGGGAFVLFTSYKMLLDAANALRYDVESRLGLPLLVQGQNVTRKMLLDQFRSHDNAVLFGTSSFWQGIDVQGEKLRNVIIVKLPFSVPDEPLLEAKLEAIRKAGGNPFMDLQVPEAIIKLKQGFGRLIRSRTDKGIVVLLDNRVRSKRYGPLFLDSLPRCRVVDVT